MNVQIYAGEPSILSAMASDGRLQAERESWGWLLFAFFKVIRALEADLIAQHDLPLTWFDLLNRLREAPEQRLRMGDLQELSLLTTSNITRLIDKMEAAGYVRRERAPEDRRGIYVAITKAGNEKINSVWSDHGDSISEHFGRRLTLAELGVIKRASRKLLADDEVPTAVPEA